MAVVGFVGWLRFIMAVVKATCRRETSAVRASEAYTAGQMFVGEMWRRKLGLWVWSREDGCRGQNSGEEGEDGREKHVGL